MVVTMVCGGSDDYGDLVIVMIVVMVMVMWW